MALKMDKTMGMKAGVVVLLLANVVAAWPVYEKFAEDPMDALPPFVPAGPQSVEIDVDEETDVLQVVGGLPPTALAGWDPFKAPRLGRAPESETTSAEPVERPVVAIPTENMSLLGIINLNGSYLALMRVGGEPAIELRRGMTIPGTEGVRVLEIRRDGLMLAQQGSLNTFMPLSRPELQGQPWYRAEDAGSIRGTVDLQGRRRR